MRGMTFPSFVTIALCVAAAVQGHVQQPLTARERRRASGETWTVLEQTDEICRSGSPHYTGTINVTEHKSIFYWFVESRVDPSTRPTILWLNGGPGASSLIGMFDELGPCIVNEFGNDTTFNPHSWSSDFNLLFIDQPVGSGFSSISDPSEQPTTVAASSPDFAAALRVFFSDIFPQYKTVPFYVAGESYAGKYVPRFLADIVKAQNDPYRPDNLLPVITGMILVDAGIAGGYYEVGQFDMFCNGVSDVLQFNQSACEAMARAIPPCEKLATTCRHAMDPYVCKQASDFCSETVAKYFRAEVSAGNHSPYDVRNGCPNPPSCLEFNSSTRAYLNTPRIQKQLELGTSTIWEPANFDLNEKFPLEADFWLPSTHDIVYLLDDPQIRVLAFAGDCDVIVNTPGTMRLFDDLPWHLQAKFRAESTKDWYWIDETGKQHIGGVLKSHSQLTVAGVRGAGHMSPQDQRAPVLSLVKNWVLSV